MGLSTQLVQDGREYETSPAPEEEKEEEEKGESEIDNGGGISGMYYRSRKERERSLNPKKK